MKISRMKKFTFLTFALLLTMMLGACSDKDSPSSEPMLKGMITSYNEFGAAMLDIVEADMTKAGFTLGDLISITVDGREIIMPYYDGFYGLTGEYMCVAYPTYPSICFTANNTGLPQELTGLEGYAVTIRMEAEGACINVQQALSM